MKKMVIAKHLLGNSSGQNLIEYLLVTAAVVLVCIVFFHPVSGPARGKIENVLNITVQGLNGMKSQIRF